MGIRVTISFNGLDTVLSNMSTIGEKAGQNVQKQTEILAKNTEEFWKGATPKRSGRLQGADIVQTGELSFTLNNAVRYYVWVNDGHMTPRGWRTRRGYRPAKRRSHVAGRFMTEKAVGFIEQNILDYLARFLDGA